MTVTRLLADSTSAELTEWQAYWMYLREQEDSSSSDGRRKWNEDE